MTGKGDRKVREWAERRNGDPLTPHDVVELVFALDEDNHERHEESMNALSLHLGDAKVRDERIDALEAWRRESMLTCETRVVKLIEKEHKTRHDAYVLSLEAHRKSDPPEADYTKKRAIVHHADSVEDEEFRNRLVWFFASNLGKVTLVLIGGAGMLVINLIVYGRP